MEPISIELGDRLVQENHGAHLVNIPSIAVKILNIRAGDLIRWSLIDGELTITHVETPHE